MSTGAAVRTFNVLLAEGARRRGGAGRGRERATEGDGHGPYLTGVTDTLRQLSDIVRVGDPDRYIADLFAPAEARPHLFALHAFAVEIAGSAAR